MSPDSQHFSQYIFITSLCLYFILFLYIYMISSRKNILYEEVFSKDKMHTIGYFFHFVIQLSTNKYFFDIFGNVKIRNISKNRKILALYKKMSILIYLLYVIIFLQYNNIDMLCLFEKLHKTCNAFYVNFTLAFNLNLK